MKESRDFESAREFARKLGLKSRREWNEYCRSGNKSDDIPSGPKDVYKNEFKGFGDWLGTGKVATQEKIFRSYEGAREFVRKLELKGYKEWQEYCKSGNKPEDIPAAPWNAYKEWKKK